MRSFRHIDPTPPLLNAGCWCILGASDTADIFFFFFVFPPRIENPMWLLLFVFSVMLFVELISRPLSRFPLLLVRTPSSVMN
jgi:hypothetical protein